MRNPVDDPREATDETLMVRYQRGDRNALALLVRRHDNVLYSTSLYLLGSEARAAELTHETLLALVQNAGSFHMETRFRPWLYRQFHERFTGLVPDSARLDGTLEGPREGGENSGHDSSPVSSSPVSSRGRRSQLVVRRVSERVAGLPPTIREILLLKLVAQLTLRELATVLDLDDDSLRQQLRFALEQIQSSVNDTEDYARALR